MPAALQRSLRAPARGLAVGLIAATLLSSALLQNAASVALQQTVDPESRGLYDILVTSKDAASAAPTMLAPNSLQTGDKLLSSDDVDALRAVEGVELAAPIAQIIVPGQSYWNVNLVVPVDKNQLVSAPEDYRVTLRLTGSDGTGDRLISEGIFSLVLDRANLPNEPITMPTEEPFASICPIGDVEIPCELYGHSFGPSRIAAWLQALDGSSGNQATSDGESIWISLPNDIGVEQRITLIDPVAERALLGAAGAFLDPLVELGGSVALDSTTLRTWASTRSTKQSETILATTDLLLKSQADFLASPAYAEYARIKRERGEEPDPTVVMGQSQPLVPMLTADVVDVATVRADLAVESFGPGAALGLVDSGSYYTYPAASEAVKNGVGGVPLPVESIDVSGLLNAISPEAMTFNWPGAPALPDQGPLYGGWYAGSIMLNAALGVKSAVPLSVGQTLDGAPTAVLDSQGFRQLRNNGQVSAYQGIVVQNFEAQPLAGAESVFGAVRKADRSMALPTQGEAGLSVGGFSEADQRAVTELAGGLPLGAYAPATTTLLDTTGDDSSAPGSRVRSFSSMGIDGSQTSAIADISSSVWRNKNRIDAVRVRVAGVNSYDSAGIAAVTQTARDIEALGYTAMIVAGSSLEPVQLSVNNFIFGSPDVEGTQRVGDLDVEQHWTVLGAAASAGNGISVATQLLMGTVLASVLAFFALTETAQIASRRSEAAVLRSLGWRKGRVMRWFTAEYAIAALLIAASAALALLISREVQLTLTVASVALMLSIAIMLTSLAATLRSHTERAVTSSEFERLKAEQYRPELRVSVASSSQNERFAERDDEASSEAVPASQARRLAAPRHPTTKTDPQSAVVWGIQRAWRRRSASLAPALATVFVMATVGAFAAAIAEMKNAAGVVSIESFGTLLPQLLVAVCGIGAGLMLIMAARVRFWRDQAVVNEVLETNGWTRRETRLSAFAEALAPAVIVVLLGSYALWFLLSSLGLNHAQDAVTAALVAGLLAAALIVEPGFTSTPRTALQNLRTHRKSSVDRGTTA